jgi:hypothetical protein
MMQTLTREGAVGAKRSLKPGAAHCAEDTGARALTAGPGSMPELGQQSRPSPLELSEHKSVVSETRLSQASSTIDHRQYSVSNAPNQRV